MSATAEEHISLRPAHPGDSERLTQIALSAKASWGYPSEWLTLWRSELEITPSLLASRWSRVAQIQDRAMGVVLLDESLTPPELEHLWVDPQAMGRGLGRLLVGAAVERCRSMGQDAFQLVADPNAEEFYRHIGAVRTGWLPSQLEGRRLPSMRLQIANYLEKPNHNPV